MLPEALSFQVILIHLKAQQTTRIKCLSSQLCFVKCKISQAFKYLKEYIKRQVLVQAWLPVKLGNRTKLPEWTPNVQYYSTAEYPQVHHALLFDIRGTLALPLFEAGGCCIGVLELIMTLQKINYAPEIDLLCKALEAVELRSSEILYPRTKVLNENQQVALSEILEVLTIVSKTHRLPLAQAWTPCSHSEVFAHGGSLYPSGSYNRSYTNKVCMSTYDIPFYAVDAHMLGFREACVEHHLLEGQGVIGSAFSSLNLWFSSDITQLSKSDYPLAHYARIFGLRGCLAVPVSYCRNANDIYILELFLPRYLTNYESQQKLLALLSDTIQQSLQNLQIVPRKEFGVERDIEIINFPSEEKPILGPEYFDRSQNTRTCEYGNEHDRELETVRCTCTPDASQAGKEMLKTKLHEQKKLENESVRSEKETDKCQGNVSGTVPRNEDKWTLQVLQLLYGRSLQEAADYLGVSRSTFKRKCRQLGIARWPSQKRKLTKSFSHLNEPGTSTSALGLVHPTQTHPELLVRRTLSLKSRTAIKDFEAVEVENQVLDFSSPLSSSNVAMNQEKAVDNVAIAPITQAAAAAAPRQRTLSINATYQHQARKLQLHLPTLTMNNLEKELVEMLNLKIGTFVIKYLDTENDWILTACDDDLQDLIIVSESTCDGIIQMIVQESQKP